MYRIAEYRNGTFSGYIKDENGIPRTYETRDQAYMMAYMQNRAGFLKPSRPTFHIERAD